MNEDVQLKRIHTFLNKRLKEDGTINQMMDMKLERYDLKKKSITLSFPVTKWQMNPVGNMHGGLICAAMDITMGCVSYVFSNAIFTPTIQMSVNFVKSIHEHDVIFIEGICDHAGSRMAQVRSIATIEGREDVVASSNGSYAINMETRSTL